MSVEKIPDNLDAYETTSSKLQHDQYGDPTYMTLRALFLYLIYLLKYLLM